MGLLSKISTMFENPQEAIFFLKRELNKGHLLWVRGRYGALVSKFIGGVFGCKPYEYYLNILSKVLQSKYIITNIHGNEMAIDITDSGISKSLYMYGTWETKSAEVFAQKLYEMNKEIDEPTVVDIGSNIGYYTLLAADAVEQAELILIEPVPKNTKLLGKNVRLNDLTERSQTYNCAIAGETGTVEMTFSTHSNLHRLTTTNWDSHRDSSDSFQVNAYQFDEFLQEEDISAADVTAVRMDVEGAEVEILEGMTNLLDSSGPLLIYFEVHNHILSEGEKQRLVYLLQEYNFDIIAAEYDIVTDSIFNMDLDVETYEDILEFDGGFNLIVGKFDDLESRHANIFS